MAERPSLWAQIGKLGLDALNEFDASPDRKELGHEFGTIVSTTRSYQAMVKALCDHIDDLEIRLTESPLKYRGVWKPGTYPASTFITHGGSVWHTDKATARKPGEGDWVLAVKRGVDAKELRQ